jgi:LacI family transcriptional regulator
MTQKQLAKELGLSTACVSMALAGNPLVAAATRLRVTQYAESVGYRPDPLISEGMSRISRRAEFRETIHVVGDLPLEQQILRPALWESLNEWARRLGYNLAYRCVDLADDEMIRRWARSARNQGVRGVFIYPLSHVYTRVNMPWDRHLWVAIGDSLRTPHLNRSGRDYIHDIRRAVIHLEQCGCKRIGFSGFEYHEARVGYPLVQAAAIQDHLHGVPGRRSFQTILSQDQAEVLSWIKDQRIDGLILGFDGAYLSKKLRAWLKNHPHVYLATEIIDRKPAFWPSYELMGQSAVNLMHRMIIKNIVGIPDHAQSVLSTSQWLGSSPLLEVSV